MIRRVTSMFVLAAALLLQPLYGGVGGPGMAQAESQYVNFENSGTKDTTIPSGKTDIYPECYGLTVTQYKQKTGNDLDFYCKSPAIDVTCGANTQGSKTHLNTHCICHNKDNESHTVKVTMVQSCSEPSGR